VGWCILIAHRCKRDVKKKREREREKKKRKKSLIQVGGVRCCD